MSDYDIKNATIELGATVDAGRLRKVSDRDDRADPIGEISGTFTVCEDSEDKTALKKLHHQAVGERGPLRAKVEDECGYGVCFYIWRIDEQDGELSMYSIPLYWGA